MTRPLSILLALALAAPLPALAATSASYQTSDMKTKTVTLKDGLQYTDLKVGKGAMPKPGETAVVHYTVSFPDGKKIESSRDSGKPFEFALGQHHVIPCWDEAVATMRVGGRRKLVCPPQLAYGSRGAGRVIPPNATLDFDIELLNVKK